MIEVLTSRIPEHEYKNQLKLLLGRFLYVRGEKDTFVSFVWIQTAEAVLRARRLARATARRFQRSCERSESEKAGTIQPSALFKNKHSFQCLLALTKWSSTLINKSKGFNYCFFKLTFNFRTSRFNPNR